MKILMVNKFHYLKGGSEKYYFDLAKLLTEKGHEVAFFSMIDERNAKTGYKEYFVSKFDLNASSKLKFLDVIYSRKNKKIMENVLDEFKPDIVHLNNFQRQLSASIISPIKKRNIPIVFTAHDVQAICPAITMLDSNKNSCEDCICGNYINCIKKNCIKSSKLKSILGAAEARYYINKRIYTKQIDYIITPSEFYREKFIKDGINKNKLEAIHNFINTSDYNLNITDDGYALYFGRLSKEKGILNLLVAFSKLNVGKLHIAGIGEEKDTIEKFIKQEKLSNRVKLLGFLNKNEMKEEIRKCKFVVVPSIWYENCPYSIIESLAIGKPVIGSNMGGIPELVDNGKCGFIYEANDIDDLSYKMKKLFDDDKLVMKFGKNAKEKTKKLYSEEIYYKRIMQIYSNLIKEKCHNEQK